MPYSTLWAPRGSLLLMVAGPPPEAASGAYWASAPMVRFTPASSHPDPTQETPIGHRRPEEVPLAGGGAGRQTTLASSVTRRSPAGQPTMTAPAGQGLSPSDRVVSDGVVVVEKLCNRGPVGRRVGDSVVVRIGEGDNRGVR